MLKMQVIGNLGQDAKDSEVNGRFAINFSVAVNQKWKDKDGNQKEATTWVNCVLWRDKKSELSKYLTKGTKVYVEGTPAVSMYQTKDHQTAVDIKMTVKSLELLDSKRNDENQQPNQAQNKPQPEPAFGSGHPAEIGDDLPF